MKILNAIHLVVEVVALCLFESRLGVLLFSFMSSKSDAPKHFSIANHMLVKSWQSHNSLFPRFLNWTGLMDD